ncbi:MAG: Tex-like N-terminal domain-containing protein, partial [Planctomycetia bacterium]|nr:Tex-like N-terminal domain-containing protein [Planctomycetia bacterium]
MAGNMTNPWRNLARSLNLPLQQVTRIVRLLDEGNTTPFIARYRRDETGGLSEETIRQVQNRLKKLRLLDERREVILRAIEAQGKLTDDVARLIRGASTSRRLEDLYLPYRPKKQTAASLARQRGLAELADAVLAGTIPADSFESRMAEFVRPENRIQNTADVLSGVVAILAERYSENPELRQHLRDLLQRTGRLVSKFVEHGPDEGSGGDRGSEGSGGSREDRSGEEGGENTSVTDAVESGVGTADAEAGVVELTESIAAPGLDAPVPATQTVVSELAGAVEQVVVVDSDSATEASNVVDTETVAGETPSPIVPGTETGTDAPTGSDALTETVTDATTGTVTDTESDGTGTESRSLTTVALTAEASHPECAVTSTTVVSPVDAGAQVVESSVVAPSVEISGAQTESAKTDGEEGGTPESGGPLAAERSGNAAVGEIGEPTETGKSVGKRKKRKKAPERASAEQQRKGRLYAAYADFSEELRRIPP